MKQAGGAGAPLVRPELPKDYVANTKPEITAVVSGVVLIALGALLLYGIVSDKDVPGLARLLLGLLGVGLLVCAGVPATRVVRSVTVDDEGLTVRGMFNSRPVRWDDIAQLDFSSESKARKQQRAAAAGGGGGLLGAAIGSAVVGGVGSGGGGGEHREGDPFEDGRLRQHYDPSAVLQGAGSKKLAAFGWPLGWSFFTELRAEAVAREVPVKIAAPHGAVPKRRRR